MKIWIDAGHGGGDPGATGLGRCEKDDNLTYALELGQQFEAQGLTPVYTRTSDKSMSLDARTALERSKVCALAISCHRNGSTAATAKGLEIWLHSQASERYIAWAREIVAGIAALGMPIRGGQKMNGRQERGIYRGFRTDPKANYYANGGTNSPSMLLEMGFVGSSTDNAWFDENYRTACAVIVKAGCKFLGVGYREPQDIPDKTQEVAQLKTKITKLEEETRVKNAKIIALEHSVSGYQHKLRSIVAMAEEV